MPNVQTPAPTVLPSHVAIIMDGNGRWAKRKGLGRLLGHREGYNALKKILHEAGDLGLKYLTVYAFSAENWRRPQDEVSGLMKLIEQAAREQLKAMHENNVRVQVAGRIHEVPTSLQEVLREGIELTKGNTGVTFTLAINYGGRAEIVDAMKAILSAGIPCEEITEEVVARHLYNPHHPEVDLMIRTAGEMRWSNFLLWQSAYAEMVVTEKPWPEFDPAEFRTCLARYGERTRKFGAVVDQP
ncbi:di-trans,poly-cis-decaprenylcistransferase [bacterium]|nr:MAG: di-trans,poly-cis-decaprenylcistransferase [bacterium]